MTLRSRGETTTRTQRERPRIRLNLIPSVEIPVAGMIADVRCYRFVPSLKEKRERSERREDLNSVSIFFRDNPLRVTGWWFKRTPPPTHT
jgi:hypothetical protein